MMRGTTKQSATRMGIAIALAVMVACAWLSPFDNKANERVDAGIERAAATYATARLLNGVLSVVQGTEISAAPAGVGMTFAPGQILEPLNDLLEQFSQVMLLAMVAFGVEKILLAVGASWMISLTLSAVAAVWFALHWRRGRSPRWLGRLLVLLLATRFAIPVALVGTDAVFQHFMESDYRESQRVLHAVGGEAGKFGASARDSADRHGLWDKLKDATVDSFSEVRTRLDNLKLAAEKAVERLVKLMAIFVLETIVLPILLIWLLLNAGRAVFAAASRTVPSGRPAIGRNVDVL